MAEGKIHVFRSLLVCLKDFSFLPFMMIYMKWGNLFAFLPFWVRIWINFSSSKIFNFCWHSIDLLTDCCVFNLLWIYVNHSSFSHLFSFFTIVAHHLHHRVWGSHELRFSSFYFLVRFTVKSHLLTLFLLTTFEKLFLCNFQFGCSRSEKSIAFLSFCYCEWMDRMKEGSQAAVKMYVCCYKLHSPKQARKKKKW